MKKEREKEKRERGREIEEKADISSISCDVCAEMLWQLLASGKRPPKIPSILATRRTNYTNPNPTQRWLEEKKKENKKERNLQSAKKPKQNSRSQAAAK